MRFVNIGQGQRDCIFFEGMPNWRFLWQTLLFFVLLCTYAQGYDKCSRFHCVPGSATFEYVDGSSFFLCCVGNGTVPGINENHCLNLTWIIDADICFTSTFNYSFDGNATRDGYCAQECTISGNPFDYEVQAYVVDRKSARFTFVARHQMNVLLRSAAVVTGLLARCRVQAVHPNPPLPSHVQRHCAYRTISCTTSGGSSSLSVSSGSPRSPAPSEGSAAASGASVPASGRCRQTARSGRVSWSVYYGGQAGLCLVGRVRLLLPFMLREKQAD